MMIAAELNLRLIITLTLVLKLIRMVPSFISLIGDRTTGVHGVSLSGHIHTVHGTLPLLHDLSLNVTLMVFLR